jgi:serine protease Do
MSPILRILALAAAFASAAAVPVANAQSTVRTGSLASSDTQLEGGEFFDEYTIDVGIGKELVAILSAVDFDPYLIVTTPSGEQFENDDYADSPSVSLVQEIAGEAGAWRVRVTSYEAGETGDYSLILTTRQRTDASTTSEAFTEKGPVPAGPTATITGSLEEGDPVREDGSYYEGWGIDVAEGDHLVLTLASPDFDAFLTFVSPTRRTFDDDDGGGNTDSKVDIVIDEPGRWTVVANTLRAGDSGGYTLTVQR